MLKFVTLALIAISTSGYVDRAVDLPMSSTTPPPAGCSGCLFGTFNNIPGITVDITAVPPTDSGVCTPACEQTPCKLAIVDIKIVNNGANPARIRIYTGSFPTPTAVDVEIGAGSSLSWTVGTPLDVRSPLTCGGRTALVSALINGLWMDAGVLCTDCV